MPHGQVFLQHPHSVKPSDILINACRFMSSAKSPASPTAAASDYERIKVEDMEENGGVTIAREHIKDGDKDLKAKEGYKSHLEHGLETSKRLPNTQDIQNAHEGTHDEGAEMIQQDDVELENRMPDSPSSPTFLDAETQGTAASLTASGHPMTQLSLENSDSESKPTASIPLAAIDPVPTAQTASLLSPSQAEKHDKAPITSSSTSINGDFDTKESETTETQVYGGSASEIQSIMDQFDEGGNGPGEEEVMSPRLEIAGGLLGSPTQHPPRKSSLEPLEAASPKEEQSPLEKFTLSPPPNAISSQRMESSSPGSSVKSYSTRSSSLPQSVRYGINDGLATQSPISLHKPLPPEPDPEPDLPFDFHRFLEQLRHRTADPVAKFLRSFLIEFGKKQWMVHEQVKIISDFLIFIANKMAQCEVWRGVSDAEFDNAKEGMEKLVMNRLYSQTFSPVILPPVPLPGAKGKRKTLDKLVGPGRRGQHQEDIERDEILEQKVRIYGWVQEEHLDITPVGDSGRTFLVLAQKGRSSKTSMYDTLRAHRDLELLKIKTYRAPRDKVICVLNCCKVIFGQRILSKR